MESRSRWRVICRLFVQCSPYFVSEARLLRGTVKFARSNLTRAESNARGGNKQTNKQTTLYHAECVIPTKVGLRWHIVVRVSSFLTNHSTTHTDHDGCLDHSLLVATMSLSTVQSCFFGIGIDRTLCPLGRSIGTQTTNAGSRHSYCQNQCYPQ